MMRIRTARVLAGVVALLLVAALAAGCGSLIPTQAADEAGRDMGIAPDIGAATDGYEGSGVAVSESAPADSKYQTGDVADVAEADRLIVRSKTLRLEVESTSETVDAIRALTKEHDGVIADMQVATDTEDWLYRYDESGYAVGDGAALRGWVTVRVPAEGFEAFIDAAMALGTVKYQSEASEDVTQQHVDMAARLENLKAEEARLREFFDAAKNVTEMLSIEQELSRVRGEIESLDAQVKYLERQAAMATVTIELTEPRDIVRPEGESWGFADAVTAGFRGAAGVVKIAITFVIATAPLWGVALIAFFVIRTIVRRRRAKRGAAGSDGGVQYASAPAEGPAAPEVPD
jgi:hypothetical protein